MPAIASLEHSKRMSEHTSDDFTPACADEQEIHAPDPDAAPQDPTTAAQPSPESTLPPEALGETHGGPLGCCLGTLVGLLLSLSLAVLSRIYVDQLGTLFQANYGLLGLLVRILMGLLACALAIFFGSVGWRLGKRFFRDYEPPVLKERRRRTKVRPSEQKVE